jgi:hypothetical protein
MPTTASGLRYPDPTAPVNQGANDIKNLATDLDVYPRGQLALTRLAGPADAGATPINLCTTSVSLPSARRIRVHVNLQGQQITAATPVTSAIIYGGGVGGTRFLVGAVALNDSVIVNGWSDFSAPAGSFTAYFTVLSSVGALRCIATQTFLTIEDVGKQY